MKNLYTEQEIRKIRKKYKKLEEQLWMLLLIVLCMTLLELCFILLNMFWCSIIFMFPLFIFFSIWEGQKDILEDFYTYGYTGWWDEL